jgi:hypothetical protein
MASLQNSYLLLDRDVLRTNFVYDLLVVLAILIITGILPITHFIGPTFPKTNLKKSGWKDQIKGYKVTATFPALLPINPMFPSMPEKFIWLLSLLSGLRADKIVYLDRLDASQGRMWEPYFNPQSIMADVGEQVHFISRLEDIGARYGAVLTCIGCANIS